MLDKLEMFIAVAKERHFGRAAASLGITQPSLSAGIKQLEATLGVRLILRGSRFGGLTPEGQSALIWARRIVGDARQLKEEMRATHQGLTGRLRLGVIPTALTWAARLTAEFCDRHPNVRFTVLSRPSDDILSMLDNLEIDAGITYLDNEPLGRVSAVPLYEESYMLICDRRSAFAGLEAVSWSDLAGQKLCLLTPDMQNRRIINRNFAQDGIEPEAVIESNSTVVLVSYVARGDWITILPTDIAATLVAGKPLETVPLVGGGPKHPVGLIAAYSEPHTPVLSALLAQARKTSTAD
nr:LysR family transcriptional regulator [uncultured Celeribacter sp.]